MVMPGGMNGRELATRLKAEKSGLKVILSTGYSNETAALGGEVSGAGEVLRKPYSLARLLEVVRTRLDAP
jgi:CheY-like chemotaxis protein